MRKTKPDLDDDDDGLLSRLSPAARTAMADTLERIAERALTGSDGSTLPSPERQKN
jgi:hypothetical protein